jgi:hypothetical protein
MVCSINYQGDGMAQEICLYIGDDGAMSLYKEEAMEPPDNAVEVGSVDEACSAIKEMVGAATALPVGDEMAGEEDAAMMESFRGM